MHKIRAWDKQKNRMVGQQWLIPGDRLEVLRLSGARDKNDIDIGEKDIILYDGEKYLIWYNEHIFRWMAGKMDGENKYQETLGSGMVSNCEVIGNLFQEETNAGKTE